MDTDQQATTAFQAIQADLQHHRSLEAGAKSIEYLKYHRISSPGWLHLGEAYLQQRKGKAALLALMRAWLLDPEAKWPGAMLSSAQQAPEGEVSTELMDILQVQKVSIAAAILVKDEARSILRCLYSIKDAVDEIIVIDTGSTDGTIDLVENFPHPHLKLIHHEWREDFADARNAGLAVVESDWVLWLDADEYLHEEDIEVVREAAGLFSTPDVPVILRPVIINLLPENQTFISYDTSRMFPTRAGMRFWGRIHEQIGGGTEKERFQRPAVRIRIYHDGYLPDVVAQKGKQARNLRLLAKMVEDEPDTPASWLFYGRETLLTGDVLTGIERLTKAYEIGKRHPEFARLTEIITWLIQAYIKQNNIPKAEDACQELLAIQPDYPDAWYYQAYLRALRIQAEIQAMDLDLKHMEAAFAGYRGIVSPDSLIKDWKATLLKADLARFAGNLAYAQAQYLEVYQRHPEFGGVRKQLEMIEQQRLQLRSLFHPN